MSIIQLHGTSFKRKNFCDQKGGKGRVLKNETVLGIPFTLSMFEQTKNPNRVKTKKPNFSSNAYFTLQTVKTNPIQNPLKKKFQKEIFPPPKEKNSSESKPG